MEKKDRKKYFEGAGTAAYERKTAYIKEHYQRMNIVLPKRFKETIDQAAAAAGMSKNAFIIEAVKEKIERQ